MKYYITVRKDEIKQFATTWIKLEAIISYYIMRYIIYVSYYEILYDHIKRMN